MPAGSASQPGRRVASAGRGCGRRRLGCMSRRWRGGILDTACLPTHLKSEGVTQHQPACSTVRYEREETGAASAPPSIPVLSMPAGVPPPRNSDWPMPAWPTSVPTTPSAPQQEHYQTGVIPPHRSRGAMTTSWSAMSHDHGACGNGRGTHLSY